MTGIVEFLTARLDEREHFARAVGHAVGDQYDALMAAIGDTHQLSIVSLYWRSQNPARVLAEVKAKRERLALYVEVTDILFHGSRSGDRVKYQRESGRFEALDVEVRRDAALYAEHPDYKQEWRIDA